MRGVNDHEAPGLLRFCLDRAYQLRFIEQMPLDAQHAMRGLLSGHAQHQPVRLR